MPPARGAGRGRGEVAALREAAGIAEAHGQDGDLGRVVEGGLIEAEPVPQAIAARVLERDAAGMGDAAWRLARDHQARFGRCLQDRARPGRQLAEGAGASVGKEGAKP